MSGDVIIRFDEVSFGYSHLKKLLDETSFSVREGAKLTLMGQNGAGKSTLFKLLTKELKITGGQMHMKKGVSIGTGLQVIPKNKMDMSVEEFFESAFLHPPSDIERQVQEILEVVNLNVPIDQIMVKKVSQFSGGQQARLLLAYALIQKPDILLLDEPTNNLDVAGIDHLTSYLISYDKTVIVISHDAAFLNSFTEGVLYLDSYLGKIDQFTGNYFDVVEQITAKIEKERMQNARMLKQIQDRKDKINFFANKGGKMRRLAAKLGDQVEEAEENMVDERKEDKTLRPFRLIAHEYPKPVAKIKSVHIFVNHQPVVKEVGITLRKRDRLKIEGPNGIGKSTLLKHLAEGTETGAKISEDVRVGFYRQDFSGLNPDQTVFESLESQAEVIDRERIYTVAAQFLLHASLLQNKVSTLSEGQKGLLCFARFVLQKPALLILDEPTNHINFRHLPVIAEALDNYDGAMILVSHMPEFVAQIKFNETLDLGRL